MNHTMYEHILVPTDGGRDAKKGESHAIELAASVGATLHALYVVEEGGNPWLSQSMTEQMDEAKRYGEDVTGRVADEAEAAGVECVTAVKVGPKVFEKVNDYVEENDIDLIVMGSGYRGKVGGLLGSTAEKVIRTADVPVTTLRRTEQD